MDDGMCLMKMCKMFRRLFSVVLCLLIGTVGAVSALADEETNAAPVSLPEATVEQSILAIEPGDVFAQRVMLYWEAFPEAHHYGMEAYKAADGGNGQYALVSSRDAFTTSGTLTGLEKENEYAVLVKAYDSSDQTIGVYAYVPVTTASADPYAVAGLSGEYIRDPVYYPDGQGGGSSRPGSDGQGVDWWVIALIAEGVVVVAGGLALILWIRKKRKNKKD